MSIYRANPNTKQENSRRAVLDDYIQVNTPHFVKGTPTVNSGVGFGGGLHLNPNTYGFPVGPHHKHARKYVIGHNPLHHAHKHSTKFIDHIINLLP